jgi:undecaprenyl diphosphate synthase
VTGSSLDSRWRDPEPPERSGRDRFHVAINMDGNGRWALARGRPREEGHIAGASAVRRTLESAPSFGITTLTLNAFSSANWKRPRGEVDNLMFLLQKYLDMECATLIGSGVRPNVIGRRDRIPASLKRGIAHVEERTSKGQRLSDFLLWESAYAELYFTDVQWPDFGEADLASAVQAFTARDRRYGGIQITCRAEAVGEGGTAP